MSFAPLPQLRRRLHSLETEQQYDIVMGRQFDVGIEPEADQARAPALAGYFALRWRIDPAMSRSRDGNNYIGLGDGFDHLYFAGRSKADLNVGDFIV